MSNTPNDIRGHLADIMASLCDRSATPEQVAQRIELAKASSTVAQAYTGLIKAEIEGVRTLHDTGMAPAGAGKVVQYNLGTGKAARHIGSEGAQG